MTLKKAIIVPMIFLLMCSLMFTLKVAGLEASADNSIYVSVGGTRNIPLGASITTGSLQSGTWSTSNSNVAEITSQSAASCTVRGISNGTAIITCRYKYYIGGTIISSSWSCSVIVGSGGGGSGGSSSYVTMTCDQSSLTLDLAKPSSGGRLTFKTNGSGSTPIYLSMDVRDGWPQKVSFQYDTLSENGSPVHVYCSYPTGQRQKMTAPWILYPKKLGSEVITFQLVTDHGGRYYNTTYQTVSIPVSVICSHGYDEGLLIQEATETQHEIWDYTCKYCGEKKRVEFTEPGIMVDEKNFPDANFRSYVKKNLDKNGFGRFSQEDLEAVTYISCAEKNIASLKGIEYFTALKTLYCYGNQLTSLDISKNIALETLSCYRNQLTSLNISNNPELTSLNCCNNQITVLDVSLCPKIVYLVKNGKCTIQSSSTYRYITYTNPSDTMKSFKYDGSVTLITSTFEPDLILPESLTAIGEEAFRGGAFTGVKLSEKTTAIGQNAFAECPNLTSIYIPKATTVIHPNAFGTKQGGLIVYGETASTAENYAKDHGFAFLAR